VFTTGGDVSATPTVDGDAVYFPDWGGNLFAVEKDSGRLIWSHKEPQRQARHRNRSDHLHPALSRRRLDLDHIITGLLCIDHPDRILAGTN